MGTDTFLPDSRLSAAAPLPHPPDVLEDASTAVAPANLLTARDIMAGEVITIPVDQSLQEVARVFVETGISGAPVVEVDGSVVGVLSESDLLAHAHSFASLPRLSLYRFGLEAMPTALLEQAYADGLAQRAGDIMSHPVVSAPENAPVEELADLMVRYRVNRVPVVRGGKPVGIVTREDVLRAIARMASSVASGT